MLYFLSTFLLIYLGGASCYMLVFALASKYKTIQIPQKNNSSYSNIAILIAAYKEDDIILDTVQKALSQNYNKSSYEIIVIADSLQAQTIVALQAMACTLIQVSFEKSTKAKAINKALSVIPAHHYDLAILLDADNVMESDYLLKVNDAFQQRNLLVAQTQRVAKNNNSDVAILDGLSEAINNTIYNLGHQKLGLSGRLMGSGMVFRYNLFRAFMQNINAIGGFDKELELELIKNRIKIHYLPNLRVYDEKVSNLSVFKNQRRRWIAAQFYYCKRYLGTAIWAFIRRGQIDFFNKSIQMLLPPRLLMTGFLLLSTILHFIVNGILAKYWFVALTLNLFANLLAIPKTYYQKSTLQALLYIPKVWGAMFLILFKLKGANKQFIHTPHSHQN
ncbi:MAG: glycosyltransferase family 2 protein [Aureispira sp.]|nr:glycosyltransferase family 2 protein [Aureispira sp.]